MLFSELQLAPICLNEKIPFALIANGIKSLFVDFIFLIVHSAHTWCSTGVYMRFFFLRFVSYDTFSGQ